MGIHKILIVTIFTTIASSRLRLSGLRDSRVNIIEVEPNTRFTVEVFGKNLPSTSYYFTTASRCEDYNRTDLGLQSSVYIEDRFVHSFDRTAHFIVDRGLPFGAETPVYHLCNFRTSFTDHKNVQIRQKLPRYPNLWSSCLLCTYCVMMSAFSSGMTIGFMRFSIADLQRMLDYNEPIKTRARRILRFRSRSNWLVCTFSLCSTVHSVIFTAKVEQMLENNPNSPYLSILVPTMILFIFAEFLPQAVCNSKFGFILASGLWPLTIVIFVVASPVAWPASKCIDFFLGRDVREVMTEEEKLNIIRNMAKNTNWKERKILERATEFSSKTVKDVMTPIENVFLLPASQKLNKNTLLTLVEKGFTRVPIRDDKNPDNIFAVLNIKELINFDLKNGPPVSRILAKTDRIKGQMKYVIADMKVQQLMQQMRTGGFHIATVTKFTHSTYQVIGIITIEDILEQIFGDIEDEHTAAATQNRSASLRAFSTDTMVLNWCREAGTDCKYPLSFSQQLLIIQCVLDECAVFQRIGIGVLQMKQLLRSSRIRKMHQTDKIAVDKDALIVVWRGTIEVNRRNEEPNQMVCVEQDVAENDGSGNVSMFVAGKPALDEVIRLLGLEPAQPCESFSSAITDTICEMVVQSDTCMYFKIRVQEIIDVVNETEANLTKSDQMQNFETFNRKSSSTSTVKLKDCSLTQNGSISRSPSPSVSRTSSTELPVAISPKDLEGYSLRHSDSKILEMCRKK